MISLRRFGRDTQAAAGIAAAFLSVVILGGTTLVVDHLWLVDHRDSLKSAADAAVVAGTLRVMELSENPDDDFVKSEVQAVAERYVRLNLLPNLAASDRAKASETLQVTLPGFNRSKVLNVEASADLGGTLLANLLFDYVDECEVNPGEDSELPPCMKQDSKVEAAITPTEIVLALDITGSMGETFGGRRAVGNELSRIEGVKKSAKMLVDILASHTTGEAAQVAVGVVPWHYRVQLGPQMRAKWEESGWAQYLDERVYPNPYDGRFPNPSGPEARDPVSLPAKPGEWHGCLDQRSTEGDDAPAFSSEPPDAEPFSMNFYTSHAPYPRDYDVSFACGLGAHPDHRRRWLCYDESPNAVPVRARDSERIYWHQTPQQGCREDGPPIHPLDSDLEAAKGAIDKLSAGGPATYSTLGMAWGMRLLDPAWRDVWGEEDSVHPIPNDEGVQKILVLLTDGDDNHHVRKTVDAHRQRVCTAAKKAQIRVFTIAALGTSREVFKHFKRELAKCSSQDDPLAPEGRYVFDHIPTYEALEDAFRDIGGQLLVMRRIL